MSVIKFLWIVCCAVFIGITAHVGENNPGDKMIAFWICCLGYLATFFIIKGLSILSTAPIDTLTESPMGRWTARSFGPWLVSGFVWVFIVGILTKN